MITGPLDVLIIILFIGWLVYRLFRYPKQSAKFIGGFIGLLLLGIIGIGILITLVGFAAQANPELINMATKVLI
tara:strand:- start:310 stop:531 length:222 start_codon:yes stop_codon:yes gene_type:complete